MKNRFVFRTTGPPHGTSTFAQCFGPGGRPIENSSHATLADAFASLCEAGYDDDLHNANVYDRVTRKVWDCDQLRCRIAQTTD